MQESSIQRSVSDAPSKNLEGANLPKKSLSISVAEQLLDLMQQVTKNDISPKTVNAACSCANAIHKFILLNLKMKKD